MKYFSAHEAKQRFGKLVAIADDEPVAITRYKRPVAYLISASAFAEFVALRDRDQRSRVSTLLADIAANDEVPSTLRARSRELAGLLGVDAIENVDATLAELTGQPLEEPDAELVD